MSKKFSTSWGVKLLWIRIEISLGINSSFINAKGKETSKLKNKSTINFTNISIGYNLQARYIHTHAIWWLFWPSATEAVSPNCQNLNTSLSDSNFVFLFNNHNQNRWKEAGHSKKVKIKMGETERRIKHTQGNPHVTNHVAGAFTTHLSAAAS